MNKERPAWERFGEENDQVPGASRAVENIGRIGGRFDAGAGLQYINAGTGPRF